ncbi:MAG: AbfB domain-containing protein [Myxococcales bacterium]|nr:AbfB domain-containing protein [Myxococcales bacterium]
MTLVTIGTTISLKSVNYPTRYVRHRNFMGELTEVASELDRKDSSFVIRPGNAGGDSISFESVNYPGQFLRHQNFELKLHKREDSDLYRKDTSFKAVPGVVGRGVSFESVNYPGHYIRHCSFRMFIDNNARNNGACDKTPAVYQGDVSFEVVPANHQYVDPKAWYRLKTQFRGAGECLEGNQAGSPVHQGAAFMDKKQNVSGQLWIFERT